MARIAEHKLTKGAGAFSSNGNEFGFWICGLSPTYASHHTQYKKAPTFTIG